MEYDICTNCIHASICKYSLKVKSMIEAIDDAVTDRFDLETPELYGSRQNMSIPVAIKRCIVEYPLKLKVECELFKAKTLCRRQEEVAKK